MSKEQLIAALEAALESKNLAKLEELANEAIANHADDSFGYAFLAEHFLLKTPAEFANAELNIATAIKHDSENAIYLSRFADIKEKQGLYEDAR